MGVEEGDHGGQGGWAGTRNNGRWRPADAQCRQVCKGATNNARTWDKARSANQIQQLGQTLSVSSRIVHIYKGSLLA